METRTSWSKIKPWILQCGVLLVIGLAFWYGIRPLRVLVAEQMNSIQRLEVLREHRSNEIGRLPELEKQETLIGARIPEMEIILSKEAIVHFVEELERLAVAEGVKIAISSRDNALLESKITPKNSAPKEKKDTPAPMESEEDTAPAVVNKTKGKTAPGLLDKLPLKQYIRLTLTVKGTYPALISYLHKIETMPYAIEVIGLALKEALKETEEAYAESDAMQVSLPVGSDVVSQRTAFLPTILSTDFDIVVYTKY